MYTSFLVIAVMGLIDKVDGDVSLWEQVKKARAANKELLKRGTIEVEVTSIEQATESQAVTTQKIQWDDRRSSHRANITLPDGKSYTRMILNLENRFYGYDPAGSGGGPLLNILPAGAFKMYPVYANLELDQRPPMAWNKSSTLDATDIEETIDLNSRDAKNDVLWSISQHGKLIVIKKTQHLVASEVKFDLDLAGQLVSYEVLRSRVANPPRGIVETATWKKLADGTVILDKRTVNRAGQTIKTRVLSFSNTLENEKDFQFDALGVKEGAQVLDKIANRQFRYTGKNSVVK